MSKIYLKKDGWHLVPCDAESLQLVKKLKNDTVFSAEIKQPRNYEFHKKLFALVKIGCDNSKSITAPLEVYRKYITIKAGYYKVYQTPKGNFIEADSISFGSMSQETFEELYKRVLDQICLDIGSTSLEIEAQIINFM